MFGLFLEDFITQLYIGMIVIFRYHKLGYFTVFFLVHTGMSQEVNKRLGSVACNPKEYPIYNLVITHLLSWESKGTPPMPPPQEIRPY